MWLVRSENEKRVWGWVMEPIFVQCIAASSMSLFKNEHKLRDLLYKCTPMTHKLIKFSPVTKIKNLIGLWNGPKLMLLLKKYKTSLLK